MVRLRYNDQCGLLWTEWFTVGPNYVIRGVINKENNYYEIRQFDNTLVNSGNAKTLRQAKTKIKELLVHNGVNFIGEIRSKT
jgi:hypothetical protein